MKVEKDCGFRTNQFDQNIGEKTVLEANFPERTLNGFREKESECRSKTITFALKAKHQNRNFVIAR